MDMSLSWTMNGLGSVHPQAAAAAGALEAAVVIAPAADTRRWTQLDANDGAQASQRVPLFGLICPPVGT